MFTIFKVADPQYQDKLTAAAVRLNAHHFITAITQETVRLWQFKQGNQGSCSEVGSYRGPVLWLEKFPSLGFGGCCSTRLVQGVSGFVRFGEDLIQIKAPNKLDDGYEITMPAGFVFVDPKEPIREQIALLKTEIQKLEKQL